MIVAQFVNEDLWVITHRIIKLMLPEGTMDANRMAIFLTNVGYEFTIKDKVTLVQRDGCAVNGAAFRNIGDSLPNATDGACLSHAMNLVGKRIGSPAVNAVWKKLNSILSKSIVAQDIWRATTSRPPPTSAGTRWWSEHEALSTVYSSIDHLLPFLREYAKRASKPRSARAIIALLERPAGTSAEVAQQLEEQVQLCSEEDGDDCDDEEDHFDRLVKACLDAELEFSKDLTGLQEFRLLLAAQLDVGDVFAVATYQLESDGFMAPFVDDVFDWVRSQVAGFQVLDDTAWRRTFTVAEDLFPDDPSVTAAMGQLATAVEPAFAYFDDVILGKEVQRYTPLLALCSAARLLNPAYVQNLGLDILLRKVTGLLKPLKFVDDALLEELREEALEYHAQARGMYNGFTTEEVEALEIEMGRRRQARDEALPPLTLGCEDEITAMLRQAAFPGVNRRKAAAHRPHVAKAWAWWEQSRLRAWRTLAAKFATISPSSAAAERAFSVFKWLFDSTRTSSKADLREASLMTAYNTHMRDQAGCGMTWEEFRSKRCI